jgi:hypothetical protein
MSNDDQKRRKLALRLAQRAKKRAAKRQGDEPSIAEILEEISEHADDAIGRIERLDARDSEVIVQEAPTSEADVEPPTVEVQLGRSIEGVMPEAGVFKTRRKRRDAGKFPAQPPPLPNEARQDQAQRSAPTPTEPDPPPADVTPSVDLRPMETAPAQHWDVSHKTTLRRVLLALVSRPGTGLLELRSGRRRAQLVIRDGQLYDLRLLPSSPKRSLLSFMVRGGKLSPEAAEEVEAFARQHGVSPAKALLGMPHLAPPEVVRASISSRLRYLLRRLLDAELGEADYYRLDEVPSSLLITSVPMVGVVFNQMRDAHSGRFSGRRGRTEEKLRGMQLERRTSLMFSFNQLGLKLHERQLVDRVLAKPRLFEKVVELSPLPSDDTVALLGALDAVGLLSVQSPGLSSLQSSSWAEEYEEAIARLEVMEARMERENYFTLFGLHWATYDSEVEKRYTELRSAFQTLNQPLGLNGKERIRLRAVRKHLAASYEVLSEPKKRQRYRNRLVSAAARRRTAGQLETLAAAAVRRKMYHSALDYVQRLLEIAPDNSKAVRLLPVLLARTSVGQW